MRFRPCIDLHDGCVKQIVGSSLRDDRQGLDTNFVSALPPSHYARMYREDGLTGGHVIKLGAGNDSAAKEALSAWPGGLQLGGGVTAQNAREWLDAGAAQVIVTSYLFPDGDFSQERLEELQRLVPREALVIDLSCVPDQEGHYWVASQRWQHRTALQLCRSTFQMLAQCCCEFLVHAVAVEGLQSGIDQRLVSLLAEESPLPVTYAGGIHSLRDIALIDECGGGKVDFTVGSALDIFGGKLLRYDDVKEYR